jgi:hypothetical protein
MSHTFPTHKQFTRQVRARLNAEYPDERGAGLNECVQMQTTEEIWLTHLGKLIKGGVQAELPVLDTLTKDQLYNLTKHYAPFESLRWYVPREFRNHDSYDPVSKVAATMDKMIIVSCIPPGLYHKLKVVMVKTRKPKAGQAPLLIASALDFGKITGD